MPLGKLLQKSNNKYVKLYLKESGRIRSEYNDQYDWAFLFKMFPKWYRSQTSGSSPLTNRRPWLTEKAIHFLDDIVQADMSVLEYGSGGSTLFFLDRGCKVTSVEHNPDWLNAVSDSLKDDQRERWTKILIEDDSNNQSKSLEQQYCLAPFKANESYDLILIDGKYRDVCFKAVIESGFKGWLIYDNTDQWVTSNQLRAYSQNIFKQFAGPTCFAMPFTETTIMDI